MNAENTVLKSISTREVIYYEGITFNSPSIQLLTSSNGMKIQDGRIATSFFAHPSVTFRLSFSYQNK